MGHTALILGDQLSHANPALDGADRVLLVESRATMRRVRYHRRRLHLVLSAMRHFADELRGSRWSTSARHDGPEALRYDDVVCAAPNDAGARRRLARSA